MDAVISRLSDLIYAGCLETPPWIKFLAGLEEALNCKFAVMHLRWPSEQDDGVMIAPNIQASSTAAFRQQAAACDSLGNIPEGHATILSEVLTSAQRAKDEYCQHMARQDMVDVLAMHITEATSGARVRLRCLRTTAQGRFTAKDRDLVQALYPRLKVALQIYAELARRDFMSDVESEATERLEVGSIVLDDHRRLLMRNAAAGEMLEKGEGFFLRHGVLTCRDRTSEMKFKEICARVLAASGDEQQTLIVRDSGDDSFLSVLVQKAPRQPDLGVAAESAIMMLIRRGHQTPVSSRFLSELFEFTPRESSLLEHLLNGDSLYEAAESLGMARGTARTHLRSIFAKTGTQRQAQLVGALLAQANAAWTH